MLKAQPLCSATTCVRKVTDLEVGVGAREAHLHAAVLEEPHSPSDGLNELHEDLIAHPVIWELAGEEQVRVHCWDESVLRLGWIGVCAAPSSHGCFGTSSSKPCSCAFVYASHTNGSWSISASRAGSSCLLLSSCGTRANHAVSLAGDGS